MRFLGLCNLKLHNAHRFGSPPHGWNRKNKVRGSSRTAKLKGSRKHARRNPHQEMKRKDINVSQRSEEVLNNPHPTFDARKQYSSGAKHARTFAEASDHDK